jgi:hypothetical protein
MIEGSYLFDKKNIDSYFEEKFDFIVDYDFSKFDKNVPKMDLEESQSNIKMNSL